MIINLITNLNNNIFKNFEPFGDRKKIKFLNKIISKIILYLVFILLFPIFRIFRLRILSSSTEAIGHQILDLTYLFSKKIKHRIILPLNKKFIGNRYFYNHFQKNKKIITINNYFLCMILFYLRKFKSICYDNLYFSTDDNSIVYKHFEKIKKTPFKKEIEYEARNILKKKKIYLNKRFVCLHLRTNLFKKYDNEQFRNVRLDNFLKCIKWLIKRKYKVVILGFKNSINIPFKEKEIINLTILNFSQQEKEILDIFFAARCDFFIATQSGLQYLPSFFHKPVLLTNAIPINHGYPIISNGIFIPKLYKKNNKFLSLKEIIDNNIYYTRSKIFIKKMKIRVIDNTPNEILDATKNLIKINKRKKFGDQTNLQKLFRKNLKNLEFKYSVYAKSTICSNFLKKNKRLFI